MKILIAEDDVISGEILRSNLENLNHTVEACETGLAAWRLLGTQDFQILISDWMMPDMDGLELCRRIRSQQTGRYLYVILLTIKCSREDRWEGFQAGADDFLSKPLDPDELEARLLVAERIVAMQARLIEANTHLHGLATTDALTGLYNHRAFHERLTYEFQRSQRYCAPLSVLMLDVDNFKHFNDTFGHPAGDEILKKVSGLLQSSARASDYVARYGGEEFAVILPETEENEATEAAERVRAAVASLSGQKRSITVSIGISTLSPATVNQSELIEEADQALYAAKACGRNVVAHYSTVKNDPESP